MNAFVRWTVMTRSCTAAVFAFVVSMLCWSPSVHAQVPQSSYEDVDTPDADPIAPEIDFGDTSGGCIYGDGRLFSVIPVNGGCVAGPHGSGTEHYDVQQGKTYQVTISDIRDCASGGTSSTIQVMVKSSDTGNQCYTAT